GECRRTGEPDGVGGGLEQAEGPGAVRAVTELQASQHLSLGPRQVRERDHDEVDDHEGLDDRDPPGLGHRASTPAGATSTSPLSPPACSFGTRTMPARWLLLTRARSVTALPADESTTSSPVRMARRSASARESSASACGRWNWSSATRSTAGPEKSGL